MNGEKSVDEESNDLADKEPVVTVGLTTAKIKQRNTLSSIT